MSAAHAQIESVGADGRAGGCASAPSRARTATIVRGRSPRSPRAPDVEISLVEAVSRRRRRGALRAGEIDLAIVTYLPELVGPDVESNT